MERVKLTKEGAEEIRRINAIIPGLIWKACRICGELAPSNLDPSVGNRHLMCLDPEPIAKKRVNRKLVSPDQGALL